MKRKINTKVKILMLASAAVLPLCSYGVVNASEAVDTINNLNGLFFDIIAAAGVLIVIIGFVFFVASFAAHDVGQRITGALGFIAGLIMFFLKDILAYIGISI